MSLHYLVKLEMLIAHMLSPSCYRNSRINPTSPVAPNSPDLNPVDNSMWKILQEHLYKTHITDLEVLMTPLMNGCRNDMIQLGALRSQSLFQFVHISYAYFIHLLFDSPHTL